MRVTRPYRCLRPSNTSCRSANCARPLLRATPPMATKLVLLPASYTRIYHPGYVAKRMEIGAVVGAAPLENVIREGTRAGRHRSSCSAARPAATAAAVQPVPQRSTPRNPSDLRCRGPEGQSAGGAQDSASVPRRQCHPHDSPLQRLRRGRCIRCHRRAGSTVWTST